MPGYEDITCRGTRILSARVRVPGTRILSAGVRGYSKCGAAGMRVAVSILLVVRGKRALLRGRC